MLQLAPTDRPYSHIRSWGQIPQGSSMLFRLPLSECQIYQNWTWIVTTPYRFIIQVIRHLSPNNLNCHTSKRNPIRWQLNHSFKNGWPLVTILLRLGPETSYLDRVFPWFSSLLRSKYRDGRIPPIVSVLILSNSSFTDHTNLLTELSPSWEAANCAAIQELPILLRNPKFHHRVHKSPPLVPILSQFDPVHTIASHDHTNIWYTKYSELLTAS
jgi:hypothetical protein